MIQGLDSASEPSVGAVLAAKAAGYGIWSGYIGTKPSTYLGLHPWSPIGFQNAWLCGGMPIGYCSGWDDPNAVRQLATDWRVRLCLDLENGIRGLHDPDASWVQTFLDVSGAGLYGGAQVHEQGFRAPFYVLGAYPTSGDPWNVSWIGPSPRPSAPCSWQWAGSHSAFGMTVDSTTFDDWFGGDEVSVQDVRDALNEGTVGGTPDWATTNRNMASGIQTLFNLTQAALAQLGVEKTDIDAILARPAVDASALANVLAAALAPNLHATVDVAALSAGVVEAMIPHLPTVDPAVLAVELEKAVAAKLNT